MPDVIHICIRKSKYLSSYEHITGASWLFLGAFAKFLKATIIFVVSVGTSVCPHGTTRLPRDGFSWSLIFKHFSKICQENSSFIEIWQEKGVLCVNAYAHFWSYLAQFFLKWIIFQTKVVEKIKTHILCPVPFFFENRAVYEIMWKDIVERDRPQMTIWRMRLACWIPKATNIHSEYVIFIAFPLQQWLYERASMLRYTYTGCLVPKIRVSIRTLYFSDLPSISTRR